jgi:transcriptional regulator with XRE-family HTH domain
MSLRPTLERTVAKKSPNPIDKHVGARVRMRRLMLDKTQVDLADALRLSFQQVQKYEKGTNRISSSRMMEMANFLSVEPAFFYEGAQRMPTNTHADTAANVEFAEIQQLLATSDGIALMKAFPAIKNNNLRRRLIELIQELGDMQK